MSEALQIVPKDPFVDPYTFVKAITSFATPKAHSHVHTLSLPHHFVTSNVSIYSTTSPISQLPQAVFLTRTVVDSIDAAYDKAKQSDTYKVHRVLISKLDDLATDLRTNPDPGGGKGLFGWANTLKATTDLETLVKVVLDNPKAGSTSLRYLWTGRPGEVARKRKEKEAIWSEGEEKERGKEIEREEKEREKNEKEKERDIKSSDDDGERPWSGRVQRKIESWAGYVFHRIAITSKLTSIVSLGRPKKYSMDFGRGKRSDSPLRRQLAQSALPSVVISRCVHETTTCYSQLTTLL